MPNDTILGNKLTDQQKFDKVYHVMTHAGRVSNDLDTRVRIQDLVTAEDILPFVPKVIKRIIVEAIEPSLLIIPNLFTRMDIPEGNMLEIGAIGSIVAGKVAQNGDYPQSNLAMDTVGATTSITVSKYGCQINVAKEVIEDNQFDIIALWLRAAGAALARLKESNGIRLINEMGITVFDNATPGNAELGVMTGRNIAGDPNGTMTLNDIFDMWAYLLLRGFTPDTLVMSPLAWKVFSIDPQLREIVLRGAVLATRRLPLGAGAPGFGDVFNGLGLKMTSTGTTEGSSPWSQTFTPVNSTWNVPSSTLPTPMKVLVTHHCPFTERVGKKPLTDVIMADSQRAGILVQKENPTTEEADIFQNSSHAVHVYERYGMGTWDQGKGIVIARNVVVDQNYIFDNVNSATLEPIPATLTDI